MPAISELGFAESAPHDCLYLVGGDLAHVMPKASAITLSAEFAAEKQLKALIHERHFAIPEPERNDEVAHNLRVISASDDVGSHSTKLLKDRFVNVMLQYHLGPLCAIKELLSASTQDRHWPLSPRDDFRPFVFANHADAELFGFLELRPGAGAGDDEVGLGADGAGGAGAEAFGLGFGFVAAHGFEAAGEDDRLAAPLGLLGIADERLRCDFGQEVVEHLAVVRLVEEIMHCLGDDGADALDRRQLFLAAFGQRRAAQLLDRAEAFQQVLRGDDPDMADAQPEQEARSVGPALGLDGGQQVVDRFLLPALPAEQFIAVRVEAENVGGRVEPAELDELGDALLAQPLDVERAAADEMPQPLESLRGADQAAGAADVDLAFLAHRLASALGAMVGEDVWRARLVARQILDDLRD